MAARHMRFDAVKAGHVFEFKGGQYIKLLNRLPHGNAVNIAGGISVFFNYDEVLDLGSFTKERRPARAGKK